MGTINDVERCHDWDGTVLKRALNPDFAKPRSWLASAAKSADWKAVLELLDENNFLINSVCLGHRLWFAPLHEAAYNDAPPEVLGRLIDLGAFRTLKTLAGQRPVDIARSKGFRNCAALFEGDKWDSPSKR